MDTIVLAGGLGERLKSVAGNKPKHLLKVNNKPVISYLLENLELFYSKHPDKDHNCYLTINPKHKYYFEDFLKENKYSMALELIVEDPSVYDPNLGPINAICSAYQAIGGDQIMVFTGDNISTLNIKKFSEDYDGTFLLGAFDSMNKSSPYDCVTVDSNKRVTNFGKGISNLVNTTSYMLNKEHVKKLEEFVKKVGHGSPFEWFLEQKVEMKAHIFDGIWIDVGTPESLLRAERVISHLYNR